MVVCEGPAPEKRRVKTLVLKIIFILLYVAAIPAELAIIMSELDSRLIAAIPFALVVLASVIAGKKGSGPRVEKPARRSWEELKLAACERVC